MLTSAKCKLTVKLTYNLCKLIYGVIFIVLKTIPFNDAIHFC